MDDVFIIKKRPLLSVLILLAVETLCKHKQYPCLPVCGSKFFLLSFFSAFSSTKRFQGFSYSGKNSSQKRVKYKFTAELRIIMKEHFFALVGRDSWTNRIDPRNYEYLARSPDPCLSIKKLSRWLNGSPL